MQLNMDFETLTDTEICFNVRGQPTKLSHFIRNDDERNVKCWESRVANGEIWRWGDWDCRPVETPPHCHLPGCGVTSISIVNTI